MVDTLTICLLCGGKVIPFKTTVTEKIKLGNDIVEIPRPIEVEAFKCPECDKVFIGDEESRRINLIINGLEVYRGKN